MDEIYSKLIAWGTLYGLNIVIALFIFIVGRWVALGMKKFLKKIMERSNVDQTIISFVTSLGYIGVLTFIIIAALSQLGIQTNSLIAVIGAAGLAVGLALQGSLANFAAGVLIIIFKPFKKGDFVDAGGVSGKVEDIDIFTTTLKSLDNKRIIIPNAKITSDNIINYTAQRRRRVDLIIGVSYNEKLDKVKSVLEDVLAKDARVLNDPAPTIGVLELADSSVNFAVRPWVKTADYWDVYFVLYQEIKERFDAEGISIPFPQQDVHLHNVN